MLRSLAVLITPDFSLDSCTGPQACACVYVYVSVCVCVCVRVSVCVCVCVLCCVVLCVVYLVFLIFFVLLRIGFHLSIDLLTLLAYDVCMILERYSKNYLSIKDDIRLYYVL